MVRMSLRTERLNGQVAAYDIVAIGGVRPDNIVQVAAAGAAVVSAVMSAPDPAAATQALLQAFVQAR
ncbi:MAG TPA: hypothetical protein VMN60_02260 [Longimicrobiales bacterium]|nr:hypothetical protein [Longimicrobiales bacterium]